MPAYELGTLSLRLQTHLETLVAKRWSGSVNSSATPLWDFYTRQSCPLALVNWRRNLFETDANRRFAVIAAAYLKQSQASVISTRTSEAESRQHEAAAQLTGRVGKRFRRELRRGFGTGSNQWILRYLCLKCCGNKLLLKQFAAYSHLGL